MGGPNERESGKERELAGDGGALWQYLQPFLIKQKGKPIPTKGWVQQLITLPMLRPLDWNTVWLETHPFTDTNPRDISALVLQVTGDPAPAPCDKCSDGKGPFRSCIMISSKAQEGPLGAIVSCANCFYHFNQTYCSHKQWGAERTQRILRARRDGFEYEGDGLDVSAEAMAVDEVEDVDEAENDDLLQEHATDTDSDDDDIMDYAMEDSTVADLTIVDSMAKSTPSGRAAASINEAEPGRPYDMWPGEGDIFERCMYHG